MAFKHGYFRDCQVFPKSDSLQEISNDWGVAPLGDEAAARAADQFECVGHNVGKRFRLRARQGNVD